MEAIIFESLGFSGKLSLKKILLLSGILPLLLYGIMATAIQCEVYDYTSQSVGEQSAIGAPTRALWITLGITYQVFMIIFGFGAWLSADHKRKQLIQTSQFQFHSFSILDLRFPFMGRLMY